MSEVKVNKLSPRLNCGTVTLGDSGDTFTIPAGVTITNNGTQTGFGRTGTVDWDTTAKTTSFTAVSGNGYFVNTTSGSITVTLPAGSAGDIVSLADYAATWQTNNVTVTPNGTDKIGGINISVGLSTEGQSVTFVYTDSTQGWLNTMDSTSNVRGSPFIAATGGCITTCGDYKIHKFTGPGTFAVTNAGTPAGSTTVDYLVLAGGGAGGSRTPGAGGGSGGGAGGYRESSGAASGCYSRSPLGACVSALPVTISSYPITVGAGGAAGAVCGPLPSQNGSPGSNTVFSTITSAGGGGGRAGPCAGQDGAPGGSGGGGSGGIGSPHPGGTGNTPPVSPPQGNPGGEAVTFPLPGNPQQYASAGGGGAGGAGSNAQPGPMVGGPGVSSSISGSSTPYASGGDGALYAPPVRAGTNQAANSGKGGPGAQGCTSPGLPGGTGGSGIVIIRYKYQ